MAITGTKAFTSGEILTANDVNQYLMRGVKVFGGTATRDAAYGGAGEPVLEEGEAAYLTDIDKLQVYGGTAAGWVNIGQTLGVSGFGNLAWVETSQTTSSTSYTDLTTVGPTVTLTTGTSAFVVFGCWGTDTGNLGNNQKMSVAVSGATTIAASDSWMAFGSEGLNGVSMVNGYIFTTLTAGSNTFTAKYSKSGGSSTADFTRRFLQVFTI
jgi:hypothetical protein